MGKLDGQVALISGASRGQGRTHAVRLAEEGAAIVGYDICEEMTTVSYPLGSAAELEETAGLVRERGGRMLTLKADVRDLDALAVVTDAALEEFGRIDIVVGNAAVVNYGPMWELTEEKWRDVIDVNLTGVFNTFKAALPAMIEGGRGGSLIATSSGAIYRGYTNSAHYTSAKSGLVGLVRALAIELAPHGIRVNGITPTAVNTPMITADPTLPRRARPDLENPTLDDVKGGFVAMNAIPVPWTEPEDISEGLLWLVSDDARFVTGTILPVDAGLAIG
jgi:(+)-trans-carveol dehydrogenase